MLRLITGRAGSGKTEYVLRALADAAENAAVRPLVLLVPEQFSFESERTLLQRFGVQKAARVQVFSFTRLAERVLRESGNDAPVMDDVTRALLMSRALELCLTPENRAEDTRLQARIHDTAYLSSLLAFSTECKQCGISPRLLKAAADKLEDGTLKTKLQDFSGVFDVFEALSMGSGVDTEDLLCLLTEHLPDSTLLDGADIYVDGFKGFTAPELDILAVLMRKANVTVTLCTDGKNVDDHTACGLFAPVNRSIRQLHQIANECGVEIAPPVVLTENHRAQNAALKAAEQHCFSARPAVFSEDASAVSIAACPEIYTECATAARQIRSALREHKWRARDVAIIVRNLNDYQNVLGNALRRAEIPYYMDEATDVYTMPLMSLCLSALRICAGGWQTDELLRMMKTGLLPFDEMDTALLENYAFMWRIDGNRWDAPFTANPSGLTAMRTADKEALKLLESLRVRLIAPLKTLRATLGSAVNGEVFARAVYAYLTDRAVNADEGTRRLHAVLTDEGEPLLAEQTAKLWDVVMDMLDRFATVFANEQLPTKRYADLFRLAAGLVSLPSIPQSLDAVQVGSADRVRLRSPKAVFILGANESVFPAYPTDSNLLSDREREMLKADGLHFSGDRLLKAAEERFFAYTAVAAPSEFLYISYLQSKGKEAAHPSALVENITAVLPSHIVVNSRNDTADTIQSTAEALDRFAAGYGTNDPLAATLYAALREQPHTADVIAAMEHGIKHAKQSLYPETASKLFGRDLCISASQADTFHRCRFQYFCQYGLRLKTRRIADLDTSTFGTFSHYILETLLPEYIAKNEGIAASDIPNMQARIRAALHAYVENEMGGFEDKPARFRYLLSLVERTCFSLLWFAVNEIAQSRFKPADYELVIGNGGVPSPVLKTPSGSISIIGKIDRVDIYEREDTVFVRVVDYKTGSKEFKLSEVPYGINMQMLLYLFAVCQNGGARYGGAETAPAGVLYLPAKDITQKNTGQPLDESRLKQLRMNGLILRDVDVLQAMEEKGEGVFIPATVEKNEIGQKSTVASRKDFNNIRALVERLLVQMANTLLAGDVDAVPTGESEKMPCRYCDFRALCGHEDEDEQTVMSSAKLETVLASLEEVADNG